MSSRGERDAFEHKQNFIEGETCPACFFAIGEGHQYHDEHKLWAFVNFLIVEYLFDYNDNAWMQIEEGDRFNIISLFLFVRSETNSYPKNMSAGQVAERLVVSGVFDDLFADLTDMFELYPEIMDQVKLTREKVLETCIPLYRLQFDVRFFF